MVNITKRLS